jgi:hypothetical protein
MYQMHISLVFVLLFLNIHNTIAKDDCYTEDNDCTFNSDCCGSMTCNTAYGFFTHGQCKYVYDGWTRCKTKSDCNKSYWTRYLCAKKQDSYNGICKYEISGLDVDDMCKDDSQCSGKLYCDKVCTPALENNQPCNRYQQCSSSFCDVYETNACRQPYYKQNNEPCQTNIQCQTNFCNTYQDHKCESLFQNKINEICYIDQQCESRICNGHNNIKHCAEQNVQLNESCIESRQCAKYLYCENNKCVEYDMSGLYIVLVLFVFVMIFGICLACYSSYNKNENRDDYELI